MGPQSLEPIRAQAEPVYPFPPPSFSSGAGVAGICFSELLPLESPDAREPVEPWLYML